MTGGGANFSTMRRAREAFEFSAPSNDTMGARAVDLAMNRCSSTSKLYYVHGTFREERERKRLTRTNRSLFTDNQHNIRMAAAVLATRCEMHTLSPLPESRHRC